MKSHPLHFQSFDGLRLGATYVEPAQNAVAYALLVHGITSERDESGFYSQMATAFAANNIASLRFEYRSHGESKLPSVEMTLSGIVNDIEAAFKLLASRIRGQNSVTFAVGTSFGGGLTAFWSKKHKGAIKGLFLCAPVIDYEDDIKRNTNNWRKQLIDTQPILYAGGMQIGRGLLNELPFINGIEALENPVVPVHIYHGIEDTDVPIESSIKYEGIGNMIELHRIPGVGHGFGAPDDDDFETAETAANHASIYSSMIKIILGSMSQMKN